MSTNLIPFENATLPAELQAIFGVDNTSDDLAGGVGAGFPSISIKGKVFHLVRGGERTLITRPDSDEPAAALEVVILKANPALSKLYYKSGFVEGSTDKPTCYSDDSIAPAADAAEPQSQKCATCPHAVWGSKISDDGKKTKACADSRRLAVAPLGELEDVMLLRIPAATLKPLKVYGEEVRRRGRKYFGVATKIGFDYTVAHPLLTFKAMGVLPETMLRQVAALMNSDLVNTVAGLVPAVEDDDGFSTPCVPPVAAEPAPPPPPAPAPKPATSKPAAKPAAKPTGFSTPSITVEATAEAPVTPAPAPKPAAKAAPKPAAPAPVTVADDCDLDSKLDAMLLDAGFEDDDSEG